MNRIATELAQLYAISMEEFAHAAHINFERIRKIAKDVAKYAGRYSRYETFLGYSLKNVTPLMPQHAESIPPEGKVKIDFAHWSLLDELANSPGEVYPDPETITQRIMSYELSAEALLEYETYLDGHNGPDDPGDPVGDCKLLDVEWRDDFAVSEGSVPDDVVEALCKYLKDHAGYISSDYEEEFLEGKLPKWDSRILAVVEEDIRKSILEEEAYEADLIDESTEEKVHHVEVMKMSSRTISSCWITQEFNDTLASIKTLKELRDRTDDQEDRKGLQTQLDFIISTGLVTEEDVALSERLDREEVDDS